LFEVNVPGGLGNAALFSVRAYSTTFREKKKMLKRQNVKNFMLYLMPLATHSIIFPKRNLLLTYLNLTRLNQPPKAMFHPHLSQPNLLLLTKRVFIAKLYKSPAIEDYGHCRLHYPD